MLSFFSFFNRNAASRTFPVTSPNEAATSTSANAVGSSATETVSTVEGREQEPEHQVPQQLEHIRFAHTDRSARCRISNLIANQSAEQPLPMLEHLARGNRQIAAFAAVLSAQAEADYFEQYRLPNFFRRENFQRERFVRTSLDGVEKDRHQDIASEGQYRILLNPNENVAETPNPTAPKYTPDRSKSEVVVHALLATLVDDLSEASLVTPSIIAKNDSPNLVKNDLIYQRPVARSPWHTSADDAINQRPPALETLCVASNNPSTTVSNEPAKMASLDMTLNHLPHADFIKQLAIRSESCATFFSFISHALLVKDSVTVAPTVRYPYVEDQSLLTERIDSTGEPFLPTFLEGVERYYQMFNNRNPTWRIKTERSWQEGQDKQSVLNHVFLQAMQHLRADAPTTPDMPIYPLVAYELLADAINVPVPPYLAAHEQRILETLTENGVRKEQRLQKVAVQQQRSIEEQQTVTTAQQQRYAATDVASSEQFLLTTSGYKRSLVNASVDIQLVPSAGPANLALIDEMRNVLTQTHSKQEISARSHRGQSDNLCWMRSSWLSVFAMASPAYLADKLPAICEQERYGAVDAPLLAAIAQACHRDPIAFLQGSHPQSTDARLSREAMLRRGAHLGPKIPLANFLAIAPSSRRQEMHMGHTPEAFLQTLQREIATAFRPPIAVDPSFMTELEALWMPGNFASSNLPISLHRALGLPVLVIETGQSVSEGEDGEQVNYSAQLRVAAPTGSNLAKLAEELVQPSAVPAESVQTLLAQFGHLPVIWLENDHYTVHLPRVPVEAIRMPSMQQISTQ